MNNNIKFIRMARGITQAQLAQLTGVGIPQVSKWETGRVDIPSSRLTEIAAALGTTPDDILNMSLLLPGKGDISIVAPDQVVDPNRYITSGRKFVPIKDFQAVPDYKPNAAVVQMEGASEERMLEDLPIYGTALGAARVVDGEAVEQTTLNRAEVVQYARRPVILNGNASAYGLYVSGSSMEPRHMDGELLLIDPKGRVRSGEDVVVYLRPVEAEDDNGEAARAVLVKRLIRRSSTYVELEQFEPRKTFRIDAADIVRIDRVIPWTELLT